jgi:hypothetical protein
MFFQEDVMKFVLIVAALLSLPALAGISAQQLESSQIENPAVSGTNNAPKLLAMGPDPGGHTGATVTPETTKTGQPAVDSAREAASGSRTENSGPPINGAGDSKK